MEAGQPEVERTPPVRTRNVIASWEWRSLLRFCLRHREGVCHPRSECPTLRGQREGISQTFR